MEIATALGLVNALVYRPGWCFSAEDHSDRFEGAIKVRIEYPAQNTNRDQAPEYPEHIQTYATFPVVVGDCNDDCGLYHRIIHAILQIEEHEARESLRVQPTMWAPFHPHRIDGMKRWAEAGGAGDSALRADLLFGAA